VHKADEGSIEVGVYEYGMQDMQDEYEDGVTLSGVDTMGRRKQRQELRRRFATQHSWQIPGARRVMQARKRGDDIRRV